MVMKEGLLTFPILPTSPELETPPGTAGVPGSISVQIAVYIALRNLPNMITIRCFSLALDSSYFSHRFLMEKYIAF